MPEHKKIIFFVSPEWRRAQYQHIPLLYPFWGNPLDKDKVPFHYALFERYGFDPAYYGLTDNEERADLVLMPYAHNLAQRVMPRSCRGFWRNAAQRQNAWGSRSLSTESGI
ncbi:MAG: hypothetical protein UX77_C0021G0005 [Parcubacteria group bacterium GW2011_GWA1_47_11]|nr:MAG: hypothetical protein UX77_C0021G0005 [Parcubacteria group bacterium GW2011_GWA1_47_11]